MHILRSSLLNEHFCNLVSELQIAECKQVSEKFKININTIYY